jgi:hypothetical protein
MTIQQAPPIDEIRFEGLADAFRGELVLPADPDYAAARAIWNGAIAAPPASLAAPESPTSSRRFASRGSVTSLWRCAPAAMASVVMRSATAAS